MLVTLKFRETCEISSSVLIEMALSVQSKTKPTYTLELGKLVNKGRRLVLSQLFLKFTHHLIKNHLNHTLLKRSKFLG